MRVAMSLRQGHKGHNGIDDEELAMASDRIHRVRSADGTPIAGRVHGQGPPLVLVPGGPADGETGWLSLLPHLINDFTCFTVNTRGRGLSDDHPDHARERLVDDLIAFIESVGDDVHLFGHSAGGTHALEAAAQTAAVSALALYEPTLTELADERLQRRFSEAFVRVDEAVRAGRPADGAWVFLEELAMANDTERALLTEANAAQGMAPLVPVVLREYERSGPPQLSELSLVDQVTMPVLLLTGSRSHPFYTSVVAWLAERLAAVQVLEVAGAGHLGPEVQPQDVAGGLRRLPEIAAAREGAST